MGKDLIMMEKEDYYSIYEILDIIKERLDKKNIVYTIEEYKDMIDIWFDKDNYFGCRIFDMDVGVSHLNGSRMFPLAEGKEIDLLSINNAIEHIFKIMSHDVYQVETYKKNRLCSVEQYIIEDGKKSICSGLMITHYFFFLPFVKKEVKTVSYRYESKGN